MNASSEAPAAADTAAAAAPAKEESEEDDDDMGFGLFECLCYPKMFEMKYNKLFD